MKTTTLRVLCLGGLAAASLAASGGAFAREHHDSARYERFEHNERYERERYEHGRFDRGHHGHAVVLTRYIERPRVIERELIIERPVYYGRPVAVYAPPPLSPSIGQMVGGIIGVVIDERNYNR